MLRYLLLAQMLLAPCIALGSNKTASCKLADQSIVSRASSGTAQVSNLGDIYITCGVPSRTFPTKPSDKRNGLTATTTVYEVSPIGRKSLVPSEVKVAGGGRATDQEYVSFYLHIPLEPEAREAEARRYLDKTLGSTPQAETTRWQVVGRMQEFVHQHREGRFLVTCRVMDGKHVMGIGVVELEVLFKGRFSDVGPSSLPPT